jgi:hypothetical protein
MFHGKTCANKKRLLSLAAITATTLLSACGGGGSSSDNPSAPPPPQETVYSGQALLGPIVDATVDVYSIETLGSPGCTVTTSANNNVLDESGIFEIPASCIGDDGYYLLVVSGGSDIDVDDDGVIDATPTPMNGKLHAIASRAQLTTGNTKINALTELAYQQNRLALASGLDTKNLANNLNLSARTLLSEDVNGDASIDAGDLLVWSPRTDMAKYARDSDALLTLVEQLHTGAPLSTEVNNAIAPVKSSINTDVQPGYLRAFNNYLINMASLSLNGPSSLPTVPVEIYDTSTPSDIKRISSFNLPEDAYGSEPFNGFAIPVATRHGNHIYLAASYWDFDNAEKGSGTDNSYVVDISNPASPVFSSLNHTFEGSVNNFILSGNRMVALSSVYVFPPNTSTQTKSKVTVTVFDIENPSTPSFLGQVDLPEAPLFRGFAIEDDVVYVMSAEKVFRADISNPAAIQILSNITWEEEFEGYAIAATAGKLLLSIGNEGKNRIKVIDPDSLDTLGTTAYTSAEMKDLQIDGDIIRGVGEKRRPDHFLDRAIVYTLSVSENGQPRIAQIEEIQYSSAAGFARLAGNLLLTDVGVDRSLQVNEILASPSPLSLVTEVIADANINDFQVVGNIAHIAIGASGYQAADISDPAAPEIMSTLKPDYQTFGTDITSLAVSGDTVVLGDRVMGLRIYDSTDPRSISAQGTIQLTDKVRDMLIRDNTVFAANDDAGFLIADIGDTANPSVVAQMNEAAVGELNALTLEGDTAYLVNENGGLSIVDISDINNPVRLNPQGTNSEKPFDAISDANFLYLSFGESNYDNNFSIEADLHILDISNPSQPTLHSDLETSGSAYRIAKHGQYVYLSNFHTNKVDIIDVSDPAQPEWLTSIATPGFVSQLQVDADGLSIASGNALLRYPVISLTEIP